MCWGVRVSATITNFHFTDLMLGSRCRRQRKVRYVRAVLTGRKYTRVILDIRLHGPYLQAPDTLLREHDP